MALDSGAEWLLTMDQDTEVTSEYLHEVIELRGIRGPTRRWPSLPPNSLQAG